MEELADGRRIYLRWVAVSLIIMLILSTISAAWYLRQQFVAPVKKIIGEAERFARDNTKNEQESGKLIIWERQSKKLRQIRSPIWIILPG